MTNPVIDPGARFAAVFDVDGTLADCSERRRHLDQPKPDWKRFFEAMHRDLPIWPVVWALQAIRNTGAPIVICTGRPGEYHERTKTWLDRWGIPYDAFYGRESRDNRPDVEVKREMLAAMRADGFEPYLVFDDRAGVVQMWRDEGLVCCQVAEGDF